MLEKISYSFQAIKATDRRFVNTTKKYPHSTAKKSMIWHLRHLQGAKSAEEKAL